LPGQKKNGNSKGEQIVLVFFAQFFCRGFAREKNGKRVRGKRVFFNNSIDFSVLVSRAKKHWRPTARGEEVFKIDFD